MIAEDRYLKRLAHQRSRQAMFEKVQILKAEGKNIRGIALEEMGVNWRTVRKWVHASEMPERRERAPSPTSPRYFRDYLADRWAKGCRGGRQLFEEIQQSGSQGSRSNMERLLGKWRGADHAARTPIAMPVPTVSPAITTSLPLRALDPAAGSAISPIVGAALCIKPRGLLTARQAAEVVSPEERFTRFCRHARAGDAISGRSSSAEDICKAAQQMARRRSAIGNLRNATLRA